MSNRDTFDDSDLERRRRLLGERLSSRSDRDSSSDTNSTDNASSDSISGDDTPPPNRSNIGLALSLSSSFVAAILVGAVLGYLIDSFFGVSPFGMIIFLLLGFCAGVLNIMRSVGLVSRSPLNFRDASGDEDIPKN